MWTSQVVQGLVVWDYHLLSSNLTTNLCLVQGFNVLRTSLQVPFLEPSFTGTYAIGK
jgi:hypothetical protein